MKKLLFPGVILLLIGKVVGIADAFNLGIVLIAAAVGWMVVKGYDKYGRKWSDPDYYTERYNAENRKRYSDDYIEAVRRNDPRWR